MIKQKDIAERAGVSRATVSRVFTKQAAIRPETLRKIQNAMYELGVEAPPSFANDGGSHKNYVMIVAGDVSNEFYSQIIKGCCNGLSKHGMYAVVCDSNYSIEFEKSCINRAIQEKYGGIILITAVEDPELVNLLRSVQIPVILANRYIRSLDMNMVCIDNYSGGYIAANYLIEHGHRKIAFLGGFKNSTATQDRFRGYKEALADAGLGFSDEHFFFSTQNISDGRQFADEALNRGLDFTAFFSTNCPLAVGAINRLAAEGISVPDDISVVCFDDSLLISEDGMNLTTVSCEPYLIGQNSVSSLLRALDGEFSTKTTMLLPPQLIERTSVRHINDKI